MTPQLVLVIVLFTAPVFAVGFGTWLAVRERKRARGGYATRADAKLRPDEAAAVLSDYRRVYPEPFRLYDAERWTDHH